MKKSIESKPRKEFWEDHIKAANKFEGSHRAYCELHGLKVGTMSSYRNKLGYTKNRKKDIPKKKTSFASVKVKSPSPSSVERDHFPDPVWLAQFVKAWRS